MAQSADKATAAKSAELSGKSSDLPAQLPIGTQDRDHLSALKGFDAGVSLAIVHDSSIGWYNVLTPAMSYSFSPHYSADVSMSIYPYRLSPNSDTYATANNRLVTTHGDLGDMLLEGHAIFSRNAVRNMATVAMGLPTGDRKDGLGTGKATFNFDDRIERYFGKTGFLVDAGVGDSSGLVSRLVTEDDSSLGPTGQFQAGIVSWLPYGVSLQSVAYEQLPIGDQKTYAEIARNQFVVTGRRVVEDNGFTTSVYVPVSQHLLVGSSYNRSLRLHIDTVSLGVTFLLKGYPLHRRESLIDRAMREAESTDTDTPQTH